MKNQQCTIKTHADAWYMNYMIHESLRLQEIINPVHCKNYNSAKKVDAKY